jgi:hypothetical protein
MVTMTDPPTSPAPKGRFRPLPAPVLAHEQYETLNESFYRAEPHEYFGTRVELLILAAAKPDVIFSAYQGGLVYGGLHVGGPGTKRNPDAAARERQQTAFVIAESSNLLHHVSETLLRFYLAHAPDAEGNLSPCPSLEIASEISQKQVTHSHNTLLPRLTVRVESPDHQIRPGVHHLMSVKPPG